MRPQVGISGGPTIVLLRPVRLLGPRQSEMVYGILRIATSVVLVHCRKGREGNSMIHTYNLIKHFQEYNNPKDGEL
jgi:hypothetical protein